MASGGSHHTYLQTTRFGSLDGLRFLCISAVIWHHFPVWPALEEDFILLSRGHTGVDFFFVLSGYLITTLLLREEASNGTFSLRAFYWRRFLRIVPVYFFVVTLAAIWSIVVKNETENIELLPYYYLFLANFLAVDDIPLLSPMWSLAVEEQFYMVWPLLLLLVPRKWILPLLATLIVHNVLSAAGFFGLFGITGFAVGKLYFGINGATYAPLFLGAGLAVILHSAAGFARVYQVAGFRNAGFVWFAAVIAALAIPQGPLEGLPNLILHVSMTGMLACLVVREDNCLAPVFKLPPIVRIGQISYGIYLYHLIARSAMDKIFTFEGAPNLTVIFIVYYALSCLIAEISFRTLEAWPMQFRKKAWGRLSAVKA